MAFAYGLERRAHQRSSVRMVKTCAWTAAKDGGMENFTRKRATVVAIKASYTKRILGCSNLLTILNTV